MVREKGEGGGGMPGESQTTPKDSGGRPPSLGMQKLQVCVPGITCFGWEVMVSLDRHRHRLSRLPDVRSTRMSCPENPAACRPANFRFKTHTHTQRYNKSGNT